MPKNITISFSDKLIFDGTEYRCAIGRGGISNNKKEGDGTTPVGCFPVREVLYRADRVEKPKTVFPTREILKDDGWCDTPGDDKYNQFVKLPYKSHSENLWREDEIYDIVVVLGFNDSPIISGAGSAVFIHISRPDYSKTDGCIALNKQDLLDILLGVERGTLVCVK